MVVFTLCFGLLVSSVLLVAHRRCGYPVLGIAQEEVWLPRVRYSSRGGVVTPCSV